MVDYLGKGCMINDGAYYAEELRRLCQEIVKRRSAVDLRCSAFAR